MTGSIIVINVDIRETRVALVEGGVIAELQIERASHRGTVGNVVLGKVTRVLPGMQAAFIDVGQERSAFLHVEDLIRPDDFELYLTGGSEEDNESFRGAGGRKVAHQHDDDEDEDDDEKPAAPNGVAGVRSDGPAEPRARPLADVGAGVETDDDDEDEDDDDEDLSGADAEGDDADDAEDLEAAADEDDDASDLADAESASDDDDEADDDEADDDEADDDEADDVEADGVEADGVEADGVEADGVEADDVENLDDAEDDDAEDDDDPEDDDDDADDAGGASESLFVDDDDDEDDEQLVARSGGEPVAAVAPVAVVASEVEVSFGLESESAPAAAPERRVRTRSRAEAVGAAGAVAPAPSQPSGRGGRGEGSRGGGRKRGRSGRDGGRTEGGRTEGGRTGGGRTEGNRADGNRSEGNRAEGNRSEGGRAEGAKRSEGGRADGGNRTDGARANGNRSDGGRANGNRADGNRTEGNRADGSRSEGNRSEGSRAEGNRADGSRSEGNRSEGNRSEGNRADANRSEGDSGRGRQRRGRGGAQGSRGRRGRQRNEGGGNERAAAGGGGDAKLVRGRRPVRGKSAGGRAEASVPPRVTRSVPITDVVKEGDHVVVQISKEPIGTKGARVTSHVSLPGRYVVYLPTVDHLGISKRIGSARERQRLRQVMESLKPARGGLIVRTVAEGLTKKQLKADVGYLIRVWAEVCKKRETARASEELYTELDLVLKVARDLFTDEVKSIVIDDREQYNRLVRFVEMFLPERVKDIELYTGSEPIFDAYGIEDEIGRALSRKVPLPSGGSLIVDQAEALTAIDVNTGRYVGKGSKDLEETALKTNLEAVEEIAYQLRFRNIGGLVILDLIDMEKYGNREKVWRALEAALVKDKAKTTLNRISELGLIEMTRKRTRESLGRMLHEPCFYCDGTGQIQSKATIAYEILRQIGRERYSLPGYSVVVNAHPAIVDFLKTVDRAALDEAERRYARRIELNQRTEYHIEQYDLQGK